MSLTSHFAMVIFDNAHLVRVDIQAISKIRCVGPAECLFKREGAKDQDKNKRSFLWYAINRHKVYYSAHYLVDPRCPVPFIYTIHDLICLKYPDFSYTDESFREKFGDPEFRRIRQMLQELPASLSESVPISSEEPLFLRFFWAINRYLAQQCQQIITVSEAVKEDIIRYLDVPATKISVLSGGVDPTVFYPRADIHHKLQRFDLESSYCLYVGLGHVHKRLPWLLQAFAQAQEHR